MKKGLLKAIFAGVTAAAMLTIFTACGAPAANNDTPAETVGGEMREITTMELVKEMGVGINLGNTLESCGSWISSETVKGYETAWGSPEITQEMIKGIADCGFGVLRIPVAWSNMMAEDYTISADYIARVKQITEWTLDTGMYAIVNIHWDNGWWEKFPTDKETCMTKYTRVWEQLCEAFGAYGDHLMFESLNEEGCWNDVWNRWGSTDGKDTAYGLLNEINQKFVDIVRASGGNNEKRHLLIAGYATDVELTCDPMYVMPTDPQNRCAVSMHYYTPSTFAILEKDADWGKAKKTWGNAKDVKELETNMALIKTTFVDKGIPVIIGEFGSSASNKKPEWVKYYLTSVCKAIYEAGACPVLWDTTNANSFYNRYLCKFSDEEMLKCFMEHTATEYPGTSAETAETAETAEAAEAAETTEAVA